MKENLEGFLLAASPHCVDDEFYHTVVLLLEHDRGGAFGVVLNQPREDTLEEIWNKPHSEGGEISHYVNCGGPFDGPVFALHTRSQLGDGTSVRGIYMTDDRPRLQLLVGQEKFQYRLYLGYAGWEPSQLEYEIDGGDWLVLKANSAHVFSSVETLWQKVFQQIGHKFVRETLQIKHIPKDVRLN